MHHLDTEGGANGPPGITGQQVAGPHRVVLVRAEVAHGRGDRVIILVEIDELVMEADAAR